MLFNLLLFGAVFTWPTFALENCKKRTLPEEGSCQFDIKWKTRNDKQALATCLEHFPTTFVTAKRLPQDTVRCVVKAAYQCLPNKGEFLMFDKCYSFPKDSNGNYFKGTIAEYENKKLCDGGELSVFYSYTQAKFVGMKANELGIEKIWIGITRDGREIEGQKRLIHSNLWKLRKDDYWDGDELKKCDTTNCQNAKYIFMRTRTDHVLNRYQGFFEQASDNSKATVACAFEATYQSQQEEYCEKLKELNIDAVYDNNDKNPRCLYVSASAFAYNGKSENMDKFKGCKEKPDGAVIFSAGLDDGTATPDVYKKLNYKGKLRIAGYIIKILIPDKKRNNNVVIQEKGGRIDKKIFSDIEARKNLALKWRHIDHHGKDQYSVDSHLKWDQQYPLNEDSDFPGESTTLGVKNGELVDLPPEVRLPAVCSISFFKECEETFKTKNVKPCGEWMECTNQQKYKEKGFYTCSCPQHHAGNECEWTGPSEQCAYVEYHWKNKAKAIDKAFGFVPIKRTDYKYDFKNLCNNPNGFNCHDAMSRVWVRKGCTMTIYPHPEDSTIKLMPDIGYGAHQVPNPFDDTLGGEWFGMGASAIECKCSFS